MLRSSVVHKASIFSQHRLSHISNRFIQSFSTTSTLESPIAENNKGGAKNPQTLARKRNVSGIPQKKAGQNSNKGNRPPWQNNGGKTNAAKNPWSKAKKGESKAEKRIADALRNRGNNSNNHNHKRNSNNKNNNNRNNSGGKKQTPDLGQNRGPSSGGIDKLREAFMQSLSADRERRQANAQQQTSNHNRNRRNGSVSQKQRSSDNNNPNAESRLDQLLRMSKQKPPQRGGGGGQSFRGRKFQGRNSNDRYNNDRQRSQEPSEAQLLQRELMQESSMTSDQSNHNNAKVEFDIILPNRSVSILELSSILRQPKPELVRVLKDLEDNLPRGAKLDEFKVDTDMAELVALELGLDPKRENRGKCSMEAAESRMRRQAQEDGDVAEDDLYDKLPSRPPVVCIMGHVDHGKTTLMDRLRQKAAEASSGPKKKKKSKKNKKKGKGKDTSGVNNVAGTEAGGITQVVSAFQIQLPSIGDDDNGDVGAVTFLDTPGHAAFKAMRQSGSNGADVIVLVVAADDGVSNQTIEIIDMYKNIARAQPGSISMVVAMTKVDKPGIDVDQSLMRIENQLMEHEIFSTNMSTSDSEFGGVEIFPVSGISGEGLDDLVEGLVLHSEIMDLRACQESRAEGLIIDAKLEKGLGVVVDCIIRWGKLELSDYVVSNVHGGRVRILNDVNNKSIKGAGPSQPVRIVGLKSLPKAGDPIVCVKSEEIAKELIDRREALASAKEDKECFRADDSKAKLDVIITGGASKKGFMANNVLRKFGLDSESLEQEEKEEEENNQIRIPVVLKADADGTLAALRDTLLAIEDESKLNLSIDPIELGIGHVTPSDVNLAAESGAAIFCFNLKGSKDKTAMALAASNNVEIRSNPVIYRLLDEAKDVFSKYCPVTEVENLHGEAKVQAVFDINNNKDAERVAGLMVEDGKLYLDKFKSDSGVLDCNYRVKRKKTIVADGLKAKSLRRVKEEVSDVRRGEECGLSLADYVDVEEGDIIECYSIEQKRRFV